MLNMIRRGEIQAGIGLVVALILLFLLFSTCGVGLFALAQGVTPF